jgi:YVTN family beta-propeller protein
VALGRGDAQLYVANAQSDDVTVIDVATSKPLQVIKVGKTPHTILVDE